MNITEMVKMYNNGSSPYEIAEHFGTYTQNVRRKLIKHGVKMRGKAEAQKVAIESGRANHPTEGRKRTDEEKLAISSSAVKHWANMSDKEREERRATSKANWDKLSPAKKEAMRKKAGEQIRKAAKEGSKLEKEVQKFLSRGGYHYQAHKKDLIPATKLEIDLYIPALRTIIEVDGLSHFEPIWGDEQLKKQQEFDTQKDGVILSKGFTIIRIENLCGSLAISKLAELESKLVEELKDIKKPKGTRKSQDKLRVIRYE